MTGDSSGVKDICLHFFKIQHCAKRMHPLILDILQIKQQTTINYFQCSTILIGMPRLEKGRPEEAVIQVPTTRSVNKYREQCGRAKSRNFPIKEMLSSIF